MLSTNLVSSQKTSDARCCLFFCRFTFNLNVFGREGVGVNYLGPYYIYKIFRNYDITAVTVTSKK